MAPFHTPSRCPQPELATPQPMRRSVPSLLGIDPLEQMARDDREDWALLRLVVCVAVATVLMAVASSFPG